MSKYLWQVGKTMQNNVGGLYLHLDLIDQHNICLVLCGTGSVTVLPLLHAVLSVSGR